MPVNNRRLRLVWDRDQDVPPEMRTADQDVGHPSWGSATWWRHARRQRWSPLNVPLVEWLVSVTSAMAEPMHFFGGDMAPSAAVRVGWTALPEVLRMWCIGSEAELSTWLGNHGFPARQSHHSESSRAHLDFRVQRECVFVALTLEEGRHMFREVPTGGHARIRRSEVPTEVPSGSWALIEQVDLEEEFLRRTPMLKSCLHFLRGRFRHSLSIALQERCRAKLVGDTLW